MYRSRKQQGHWTQAIAFYLVVIFLSCLTAYVLTVLLPRADTGVIRTDASSGWLILGVLSGGVSGVVFCSWYGLRGLSGYLISYLATFTGFLLGGAIIGTIFFPVVGTACAIYIVWCVFSDPTLLTVWAFCVLAMHIIAKHMRSNMADGQKELCL